MTNSEVRAAHIFSAWKIFPSACSSWLKSQPYSDMRSSRSSKNTSYQSMCVQPDRTLRYTLLLLLIHSSIDAHFCSGLENIFKDLSCVSEPKINEDVDMSVSPHLSGSAKRRFRRSEIPSKEDSMESHEDMAHKSLAHTRMSVMLLHTELKDIETQAYFAPVENPTYKPPYSICYMGIAGFHVDVPKRLKEPPPPPSNASMLQPCISM